MASIKVLEGRKLISTDPNGLSDPYCLIGTADPLSGEFVDKENCVRSETKRWTLSPVWKKGSIELNTKPPVVRVEVWDKDEDKEDDFVGYILVDLAKVTSVQDLWVPLLSKETKDFLGEIHVIVQVHGSFDQKQNIPSIIPDVVPPVTPSTTPSVTSGGSAPPGLSVTSSVVPPSVAPSVTISVTPSVAVSIPSQTTVSKPIAQLPSSVIQSDKSAEKQKRIQMAEKYYKVAFSLQQQGQIMEALEYFNFSLSLFSRLFGSNDRRTVAAENAATSLMMQLTLGITMV